MAHIQVTIDSEQLKDLFTSDESMRRLLETVLNQSLEAEVADAIGAERYERTDERQTYRNGYRTRRLTTRVGTLVLRVPQTRDGSFSTELFRRYQRSEQALVLALMEMVLQGVSTRKVTKITEELCGVGFSKSTVSRLCQDLDVRVEAWKKRPLGGVRFPFVIVDALAIKVRRQEAVRSASVLIALGINEEGYREVLGLSLGDSESESTWSTFFRSLKERGLSGVDLMVSDDHLGLVKAAERYFQGAMWQRCQTHLMRNVLGATPASQRALMVEQLRRLFRSETKQEARSVLSELVTRFEGKADSALEILESAFEAATQVLVLPELYRRKLRTTNMCERLNGEVRRRERVIRIFPNDESATRLIGALLAEQHETWLGGRRYLDMEPYRQWKQALTTPDDETDVIRSAA
jgi:putative transposase